MAVHAALLIASLPGGNPGIPWPAPQELRASLVPAPPSPGEESAVPVATPPVLAAPPEQSPIAMPMPQHTPAPSPPSSSPAARVGVGTIDVVAEPLADRARLGSYLLRQTMEFKAEIDRPVRLDDKIVARFPASALAQGREDVVAVWVIVDPSGNPEEIHVAEGSEEFANEVVAAVRRAHFLPAEDNLMPIRFPIALQFDFRTRGAATAKIK